MKVLCRKIISRTTKEDLGNTSPWLIKDKEYVVLALNYFEGSGFDIYVQTEDHNEPSFIGLCGFEILNQNFPSCWVTVFREVYNKKVMTMLPGSWNYESFFEDMEDQHPNAIMLFNKEVEQIYLEEDIHNR